MSTEEMISLALLMGINVTVPLAATMVEWVGSSGISERHHSHHDTYVVSRAMSRVLMFAMVLMGGLGVTLGLLSIGGVFNADPQVMLGFFASFVFVTFVMWFSLRHYRVMTYSDRLEVRPFVGLTRSIRYDEIDRLRWSSMRPLTGNRNMSVIVGGRVVAVLVSMIDLEQVLLRINRADIVE